MTVWTDFPGRQGHKSTCSNNQDRGFSLLSYSRSALGCKAHSENLSPRLYSNVRKSLRRLREERRDWNPNGSHKASVPNAIICHGPQLA